MAKFYHVLVCCRIKSTAYFAHVECHSLFLKLAQCLAIKSTTHFKMHNVTICLSAAAKGETDYEIKLSVTLISGLGGKPWLAVKLYTSECMALFLGGKARCFVRDW
jgi:hypothetical protein